MILHVGKIINVKLPELVYCSAVSSFSELWDTQKQIPESDPKIDFFNEILGAFLSYFDFSGLLIRQKSVQLFSCHCSYAELKHSRKLTASGKGMNHCGSRDLSKYHHPTLVATNLCVGSSIRSMAC
jgi:hypothetical protein